MSYRRFLLLFNQFPIEESQVKAGNNVWQVIVACRCINVGLFISGDLRRNVEVSIAYGDSRDLQVITFPGATLKRVSPDERSISFFLLKAARALESLSLGESRKMDNGIEIRRVDLMDLLALWPESDIYLAADDIDQGQEQTSALSGLFVYAVEQGEMMEDLSGRPPIYLPRPTHPERFILDINFAADRA
ncbi:MAG: hypothetical protein ACE5H4_02005 [Candidatus Thorarchaeota archaeon]